MTDVKKSSGYTIVELVSVILLVGIVSAVTMSRMSNSDSYNPVFIRDEIISQARSAQQKAIGRSDVILTIEPNINQLEIRLSDSTGLLQSSSLSIASVILTGDINVLDSCNTEPAGEAISNSAPFVLTYDSLGNLLEAGVTATPGVFPTPLSSGARICVNNDPAMSVCFSAAGYAYAGDCIE